MLFPHRNWRPFTLPATLLVTQTFPTTLPEPYPKSKIPTRHSLINNKQFFSLTAEKFTGTVPTLALVGGHWECKS